MADHPQFLSKPKLLIGEGEEEVRFFTALLKHLSIEDIQTEQYGGKRGLTRYLRNLPARSGYPALMALAVTRDADDNASDAFQRVRDTLRQLRFPTPDASGRFADGSVRAGVFILPDGRNPGMLEDVCLTAIQSYPEQLCVETYFKCVADVAHRQSNNPSKARVHAWLASQPEPDKRLGEAAEAGYWPWDNPAFDLLKQFLRAL